jgi:hypothetical protein
VRECLLRNQESKLADERAAFAIERETLERHKRYNSQLFELLQRQQAELERRMVALDNARQPEPADDLTQLQRHIALKLRELNDGSGASSRARGSGNAGQSATSTTSATRQQAATSRMPKTGAPTAAAGGEARRRISAATSGSGSGFARNFSVPRTRPPLSPPRHAPSPQRSAMRAASQSPLRTMRPRCRYGAACYRRNPEHFKEFSHDEHGVPVPEDAVGDGRRARVSASDEHGDGPVRVSLDILGLFRPKDSSAGREKSIAAAAAAAEGSRPTRPLPQPPPPLHHEIALPSPLHAGFADLDDGFGEPDSGSRLDGIMATSAPVLATGKTKLPQGTAPNAIKAAERSSATSGGLAMGDMTQQVPCTCRGTHGATLGLVCFRDTECCIVLYF